MKPYTIKNPDSGIALIVVIWALVVLAGIATGFTLSVRHQLRLATDAVGEAETEAATQAGIAYALIAINRRRIEERWRADRTEHLLNWNDHTLVRIRVTAETGKVDLNFAPPELLRGLLEQVQPDVDARMLVDRLIDWRDPDERPRPHGAERIDYLAAGRAAGPPNRPFRSIHELNRVLGFDPDTVERLLPHVTIHSRQARINVMSASLPVLLAIPGVDETAAMSFIEQRKAAKGKRETIPFHLLQGAARYIDTRIENRNLSLDIAVELGNTQPKRNIVIVRLGRDRYYRPVSIGAATGKGERVGDDR